MSNLETMQFVLMSAFILHNIILLNEDIDGYEENESDGDDDELQIHLIENHGTEINREAQLKRDVLAVII